MSGVPGNRERTIPGIAPSVIASANAPLPQRADPSTAAPCIGLTGPGVAPPIMRTMHPARSPAQGADDESMITDTGPIETAAAMPVAGARIGQCEITGERGRGGMGAVYAARDTKLGRKVAIKFLNSHNQPELTARFTLEARATARWLQ